MFSLNLQSLYFSGRAEARPALSVRPKVFTVAHRTFSCLALSIEIRKDGEEYKKYLCFSHLSGKLAKIHWYRERDQKGKPRKSAAMGCVLSLAKNYQILFSQETAIWLLVLLLPP